MCTIMTVDGLFWKNNRKNVLQRMELDAQDNDDGFYFLMLTPGGEDVTLTGMRLDGRAITTIKAWMDDACDNARFFLHQRYATTGYVGIEYNHGFTNGRGKIIMHNGILSSPKARARNVDSFELVNLPDDGEDALSELITNGEDYANVIRIEPASGQFDVLRLSVGSLYTDGLGNYATNMMDELNEMVEQYSCNKHEMKRTIFFPRYAWEEEEEYEETYSDIREIETILAETSRFYVAYIPGKNEMSQDWLYLYSTKTGRLLYKEEAHHTDVEWQANTILVYMERSGEYEYEDDMTPYENHINNTSRRGVA